MRRLTVEGVRWRVAYVLNRLPWTCWPPIATWALDGRKRNGSGPRVLQNAARSCRREAATHRDRSCYCGKFRSDGGAS